MRRICREADLSSPRFYRLFGSLESLVERAGLKLDSETKQRIRSTRKASRKHSRKKKRTPKQDSTPIVTVESESTEQSATSIFEELQENLETEEEARQSRLENIGRFAGQIEMLALNDNPEISQPVLDALYNVVPTILQKKHNVTMSIKDLIQANQLLHQVQQKEKRLREKEFQLGGLAEKLEVEKQQIQSEWESIKQERKNDPEKASLQKHVDELEGREKVLTDRLAETYANNKNFRLVVNSFLAAICYCDACGARFRRNMTPYKQVLEWLYNGQWMLLTFETLDPSRLVSRKPS